VRLINERFSSSTASVSNGINMYNEVLFKETGDNNWIKGKKVLEIGARPFVNSSLDYWSYACIDRLGYIKGGTADYFDLIVSSNAMEYVEDLNAAFRNMKALLKQRGVMIHRVNAGSPAAITRYTKNHLSQFIYSDQVWKRMFSHRDAPTRRLLPDYIKSAQQEGISMKEFFVDDMASDYEINDTHRFLFDRFRQYSCDKLRKTGFILWAKICD